MSNFDQAFLGGENIQKLKHIPGLRFCRWWRKPFGKSPLGQTLYFCLLEWIWTTLCPSRLVGTLYVCPYDQQISPYTRNITSPFITRAVFWLLILLVHTHMLYTLVWCCYNLWWWMRGVCLGTPPKRSSTRRRRRQRKGQEACFFLRCRCCCCLLVKQGHTMQSKINSQAPSADIEQL